MKNYKKKSKSLLSMIIIFIFVIGFSSISYGEEKFEIKVEEGFHGYYKYGQISPIKIEVKNKYKDLNAKIQLLVENGSERKIYTAFSKGLNIAKGATKTINMKFFINNDMQHTGTKLRILNNNGKKVFEKDIKINKFQSPKDKTIGILSDDIESIRYLNYAYRTRTNGKKLFYDIAELKDIHFDVDMLNTFDVIVINNYNIKNLDKLQISAIKNWTSSGGKLLIGTGSNGLKNLKGLDNFVKNTDGFTKHDYGEFTYSQQKIGQGNIFITNFDLGMVPFIEYKEKEAFISKMLSDSISIDEDQEYERRIFNNLENLVRNIPMSRLPSINIIFIILGIFILLVGPINYIILKKIDKREKAWISIPIIVVVFSTIIYLWGIDTTFKKAFTNNISILKIKNDTNVTEAESISGIMASKKGDVDISTNEDVHMLPADRYYRYRPKNEEEDIAIEYLFDVDKHIILKNKGLWDIEVMNMKRIYDYKNSINGKVMFKKNEIVGTVENLSSLNIEDGILFYGNKYQRLGNIEKGKTKEIKVTLKDTSKMKISRHGYYRILDALYPRNNQNFKYKSKEEDILSNVIKREILEEVFETDLFEDKKIKIIGWNREEIAPNIKINGKNIDRIDRNLIIIPIQVEYEKGSEIEIPNGLLETNVIETNNMHYEKGESRLWGEGYGVFSFNVLDNIELLSMDIDLKVGLRKDYDIFIYNYKTNKWEKYDKNSITINNTNKEKYYNIKDGTKVKIDVLKDRDIQIPDFSIKGVVK